MRNLDPEIKYQTIIRNQLFGALQADVMSEVRAAADSEDIELKIRANAASRGLRVTEKTMPKLYQLFEEVKQELEYTGFVELYVIGSNEVNADSTMSEDPNKAHIIRLFSALYNLLDDDELKFILGHELGHIINEDSRLSRLYRFFYEDEDDAPEIIMTRKNQYDTFAEYAADRYGYNACKNLKAAISAFFKMTSGLNIEKMGVDLNALLEENYSNLSYLFANRVIFSGDEHPVDPLRIEAMWDYATCKTKKDLDSKMEDLYSLIPNWRKSYGEQLMARYCAAAGILMGQQDGKIDKWEKDMIIEEIAKYELEASKVYKEVLKSKDIQQVFDETIRELLDINEELKEDMLKFYIQMAFADKAISKNELEEIKAFGRTKLEMELPEIYDAIVKVVKEEFWSLADSL